jgi:hypothetical protein
MSSTDGSSKRVGPYGAQSGPERRRLACPLLVHVMVEEVSELRDDAWIRRPVVVGPEERRQLPIGRERLADAHERVPMRQHVGVDEDDDVPRRVADAGIAGGSRAVPVRDDDDLLGRLLRGGDGLETRDEGRRVVRRRYDGRQRRHRRRL